MPRLTTGDLQERRSLQDEGDGEFSDPTTAQAAMPLLMAEVEALWAERDRMRLAALREVAKLLEKRLGHVGTYGGRCSSCKDGEARGFLQRVQEQVHGQA
jgi:hypothetical protein